MIIALLETTNQAQTADRRSVIQRELAWHEEEAERRYGLDLFLYAPPAFDAVNQSMFGFLQLQPGERILDLGGGEGKETLKLAEKGVCVFSIDLSHTQLLRARASINEQPQTSPVYLIQASAEELPFAKGSFRIVHGKAILHHLDLNIAAMEINRILQPGGRATFAEPLANHPLIWLGRRLTPRLRTQDEHPLTVNELELFTRLFKKEQQVEALFLLAPLAYPLRLLPYGERLFRRIHTWLIRLDRWLLSQNWLPLQRLSWYAIVKLKKKA
jgi:SAM-dependent methyltransferase